jgi:hypothetical protein
MLPVPLPSTMLFWARSGLRRVIQLPENDGGDGVGYGLDYPSSGLTASIHTA